MMKCLLCTSLILCSALTALGQTTHDRNLVHKRVRLDVTTASPSQFSAKAFRSENEALQRTERDTARTLGLGAQKQIPAKHTLETDKRHPNIESQYQVFRPNSAALRPNSGRSSSRGHGRHVAWVSRNGR